MLCPVHGNGLESFIDSVEYFGFSHACLESLAGLVDVNVDGNGKATVIVTASGISSNAVVEIIMEYSEVK